MSTQKNYFNIKLIEKTKNYDKMIIGDNMLDAALKAIEENSIIEENIKGEIKELIVIFNTFFPTISLENFSNRIKTLQIEKTNKFVSRKTFDYKPKQNILSFNVDKIKEDCDMRHVMMSSLLNIITAKDNFYGFDRDNKLLTFNIGYTEILSNLLVGNEGEISEYDDEIVATNLIAELIGNDVLFTSYFANDYDKVVSAIKEMEALENGKVNTIA